LSVLDLPSYKPSAKDVVGGMWLMHRGIVLMENQKYDDAAKVYQEVVSSSDLKPFQPEALLKLGVVYEQKGEADKARQAYEKLAKEFPNTDASTSAQQYLRLLDLKSQKG
jgi:TolA-binding protein